MPVILFLGVALLLSSHTASAASLASLLRAAGLSAPPKPMPAAAAAVRRRLEPAAPGPCPLF